jgi:hypothetical protein
MIENTFNTKEWNEGFEKDVRIFTECIKEIAIEFNSPQLVREGLSSILNDLIREFDVSVINRLTLEE